MVRVTSSFLIQKSMGIKLSNIEKKKKISVSHCDTDIFQRLCHATKFSGIHNISIAI